MSAAVFRFDAMASACAVHLCPAPGIEVEAVAAAAEAEVRRIEARYSRYRADSELTRLNRAALRGDSVEIDDETAGLLGFAQAIHRRSGGAFDITAGLLRKAWNFKAGGFKIARLPDPATLAALLPRVGLDKLRLSPGRLGFAVPGMELDLGGLGKEYAADRAAEICAHLGARHGFVDLAGDIRVIGAQPDGAPWRIGIRDPGDGARIVAEIALAGGALATSGDYERFIMVEGRRYGHILDPRSGWPEQGLSSVTVIAEQCLVAGSLATAALAQGTAGLAWLADLGVRHLAVDAAGAVHGTELDAGARR
jgi:thiamine biosynthesis lipoprotein